jgi:hypothetical protein
LEVNCVEGKGQLISQERVYKALVLSRREETDIHPRKPTCLWQKRSSLFLGPEAKVVYGSSQLVPVHLSSLPSARVLWDLQQPPRHSFMFTVLFFLSLS